jgi:hypothetical protein
MSKTPPQTDHRRTRKPGRKRQQRLPILQARTEQKQAKFLLAVAAFFDIAKACKAASVARATVYGEWLKQPPFKAALEQAIQQAADSAEAELYRRGVKGVLKPVFYRGRRVADVTEYSDGCLTFYLKGRRAEVYRDRVDVQHKYSLEDLVAGATPPEA